MNKKTNEQEHRNPRQIDDGDRAGTGEKGTYLIEIAYRLGPFARMPVCYGQADHRAMDSHGKMLIEQRCRAHDHAGANEIKRALERISAD